MIGNKLRGLVGQSLGGRKKNTGGLAQLLTFTDLSSGSGSISPAFPGVALIFLWGGGGQGELGATSPGGGAAALYKRVRVAKGQTLAYSVGAGGTGGGGAGGDTTLTLPTGEVLRARGGGAASGSPGAGGVASGGDLNRNGQTSTNGNPGGNSGSFSDQLYAIGGGVGSALGSGVNSAAGGYPGGGSGGAFSGATAAGAGGAGRVLVIILRTL